ncbi:pirin family protein [Demequina sp. NBRC 110056]|uniref:pirin family protein n=1 Tax=Demequina sp. NBRC 110056 TaxID=1570345 RepID=UPI000A012524|nr:pirin family protein [Demequina sp. NBRC 110056]
MTRLDAGSDVTDEVADDAASRDCRPGPRAILLEARDVPLGGLRAMTVRRALPQRALPTIGAWCFVDRFGPQVTTMTVDSHPHTGLQTVTWPLTGEARHRDSLGSHVVLQPGALNLMTAGHGIAHTEHSVTPDSLLDAIQLWVALPEQTRHGDAAFETHPALPQLTLPGDGSDAHVTVVLGELAGVRSPATVHTPIVGAQVELPPGAAVPLPLDSAWEHGILHIDGDVEVIDHDGTPLGSPRDSAILYLGTDRSAVTLRTVDGARVFVLGGEPFPDDLVMWWNFVGRSHDEIAEARAGWESHDERFGIVPEAHGVRIPAPPLPAVRLTPRRRRALD